MFVGSNISFLFTKIGFVDKTCPLILPSSFWETYFFIMQKNDP